MSGTTSRGAWRRVPVLIGTLLVGVGLGADLYRGVGLGSVGPLRRALIGLGVGLLPLALLRGAWLLYYARAAVAVIAIYVGCLSVEVVISPPLASFTRAALSTKGYVRPSSFGGYELTPGWRGVYDDGIRPVGVAINDQGDRDDPPDRTPASARQRLLLLGDSFTYGVGLEKSETIEGQIEALSHGTMSAYSFGVPGYGPSDTLAHFRERTQPAGTHAIFLLYENDLRFDNCGPPQHTAYDGFIVPRNDASGSPLGVEALEKSIAEKTPETMMSILVTRAKDALLLTELRRRIAFVRDPDIALTSGPPSEYSIDCARSAARYVDEIRSVAAERGERFLVLAIPTIGEVAVQRYSAPMQTFIDEIKAGPLQLVEVRESLRVGDYFPHHEHLAPSGARKVAEAILRAVQPRD